MVQFYLFIVALATIAGAALAKAPKPRIMGGNTAKPGQFPFYVQLEIGCGGSLIAPDLLVTAAHCFDKSSYNYNVYVGAHNSLRGQFRVITATSPHPLYNPETKEYDLLIAKLNVPVQNVDFPRLNDNHSIPLDMQNLTVIGFGSNSSNSSIGMQHLQEAVVESFPESNCSQAYGDLWMGESMMCAGTEEGGIDSCRGDSGGPLLADGNLLVGIVSVGHQCGDKQYPGIYSRISMSVIWAKRAICMMSDYKPVRLCGTPRPTNPPTVAPPVAPTTVAPAAPTITSSLAPAVPSVLTIPLHQYEPASLTLELNIHYDAYAIENKWELRNIDEDEVIDEKGYYTSVSEGLMTNTYYGLKEGNYSFVFQDFAKDGICCIYGDGYIQLIQIGDSGDHEIWYQRGNFTNNVGIEFELKPMATFAENTTVSPTNSSQTLASSSVPQTAPPVPQTNPPVSQTPPPVPQTNPPVPQTPPPVPQTNPPVPQTTPPVAPTTVTPTAPPTVTPTIPPTNKPTPNPAYIVNLEPTSLSLQLNIYYDAHAIENMWELRNMDRDEVIDQKAYYTTVAEGLTTQTYHDLREGNYSFTFHDFAKDGISYGYIQLLQIYDDDVADIENRQIWYQAGSFTDRVGIEFELMPFRAVNEKSEPQYKITNRQGKGEEEDNQKEQEKKINDDTRTKIDNKQRSSTSTSTSTTSNSNSNSNNNPDFDQETSASFDRSASPSSLVQLEFMTIAVALLIGCIII